MINSLRNNAPFRLIIIDVAEQIRVCRGRGGLLSRSNRIEGLRLGHVRLLDYQTNVIPGAIHQGIRILYFYLIGSTVNQVGFEIRTAISGSRTRQTGNL